jgi:hypothetical protein
MGEEHRPSMGTRRAVAAGLTTSLLLAPLLARAQPQAAPSPPFPAPAPDLLQPVVPQPAVPQPVVPPPAALAPEGSVLAVASDMADRMTVPVRLNGAGPYPFVVDTGSNRTVVSDVLAQQLGLPVGEVLQVHTATGVSSTPSVRIAELTVGNRRLRNLHAPVLTAQNLGALGMLGIDAVADQRLLLDFRHHNMSITGGRTRQDDMGSIIVRARSKYGQLLLVDASVESIALYVIIDTGGEMTIGNLTLRKLLERRRSGYLEPIKVTSVTGEEVVADLSLMPTVHLGNVIMNNLQVAYADMYAFAKFGLQNKPAMLLGMNTLRHFERVSIDFPAREVRFLLEPL